MPGPKLVKRARQEAAQRKRSKLTPEVEAKVRAAMVGEDTRIVLGSFTKIDKIMTYARDIGVTVVTVHTDSSPKDHVRTTLILDVPREV